MTQLQPADPARIVAVAEWICSECGRLFGCAGQSHDCAPGITRKVVQYGARYWHVANVREPGEVDAALLDLLTEAYHDEPG